jgi:hypothetical protein
MEDSNLTAYRLQNYEPPPEAAAAAPGMGIPGLQVPPQLQQWVEQGAQALGLQQLIPPGLLPGLTGQQPLAAADTAPRFHTFRILSQTQVIDPGLKEELGEILGDEDNFQAEHASCAFAEFGLAFTPPTGGPSNDLLISFSCNHVMPQSFAWPHPNRGLKPSTMEKLAEVVNKLWPPGT